MSVDRFNAQVDTLRRGIVSILADLKEKTAQFELPASSNALEGYQEKLAANTYTVLVVGEANRGKSSFVNALIGRRLLPTNVAVATSQVFRVSNAEKERLRLRFEDDSTQEISEEELPKCGSQMVEQGESMPTRLDQLRWIEVDVPIRYLPSGMSLMDTPGLGAIYAAHAQITQRFVPLADAVIFVLESNQPINHRELEFIETILSVTRHIFFVQTKIDLHRREIWQRVQERNEEILQKRFRDRLTDTRVWPISSHSLLKATEHGDSTQYLKSSRQKELIAALEPFLFKVAGWNRCVEAILMASHDYTFSRGTLVERLREIASTSRPESDGVRKQATYRKQQIASEWEEKGTRRHELKVRIQMIANVSKRSMIDLLEPMGKLEVAQRQKINQLKTLDEARQHNRNMHEQVVAEAVSKWHVVCEQSHRQYGELLSSIIDHPDALIVPPEVPDLDLPSGAMVELQDSLHAKINNALNNLVNGITAGQAIMWVPVVLLHIAIPATVIGYAIAVPGIWGVVHGWKEIRGIELEKARTTLRENLSTLLQKARKCFLEPDLRFGGKSLMDYHFDSLVQGIHKQIDKFVEKQFAEAERECKVLEEQSKLDKLQRITRTEELQHQLAEWNEIGDAIRAIATELQVLELP
ncbi:MAG: hypothetical protein NVSMB27_02360 [Ktedonobacteraceae bacterium]